MWQPLSKYLLHGGFALQGWDELIAQGKQIAAERRFFHWELEFPEVFFDPHGRLQGDAAGFDAVIGNPPYVRQEELSPLKPYFALAYPKFYSGTADLFVYFFGQAIHLLREGGLTSYISSNSWLRANYATLLRQFLRTQTTIVSLVDLGDNRVFPDAPDVYPAIHVVRRAISSQDHSAEAAVFNRGEGIVDFLRQLETKIIPVTMNTQRDAGWQLEEDNSRRLFEKLMAQRRTLADVTAGKIYRGILTGLNEAFIVDEPTRLSLISGDPDSKSLIKPLINGANVRSWYCENSGQWLVLLHDGWTREMFGVGLTEDVAWQAFCDRFPHLARHLEPYAQSARARADKGAYWWELRPCSYYDEFAGTKLLWPEMAKEPRFALAEPGMVSNKTTFMIPGNQTELLGLLMSRVMWFAISKLCVPIGERGGRLRYTLSAQFMSQLPIPETEPRIRRNLEDLAIKVANHARARHFLHQQSRHRIATDLGMPDTQLNQKLTTWWELDFPAFRSETKKVFKRDIPLKQRDEWESWLAEQRAEHERLTAEIVRLETELNARVYELFDLTPTEIKIIEESTKYRYGEA